jgi:hypothetical protein
MAVGPASIARPAPLTGRPWSTRRVLEREGLFSWLMLAPGVLFLLAFVAYPFFYGIYLSLQARRVSEVGTFVGFANFTALFQDRVFWQVAQNTFVYTIVATVLIDVQLPGFGPPIVRRAAPAVRDGGALMSDGSAGLAGSGHG